MKKRKRAKIKTIDPFELEFIGNQYLETASMQLFQFDKDKFTEIQDFKATSLEGFPETESVYWLNIHGIHDVELIKSICFKLGIHRLVVQDILDTNQRPKLQEFDEYIFFSVKSILPTNTNELKVEQISFILGSNYVLSFQEKPADYFEHIRQRIREYKGLARERTADFLLYLLLESILDNYYTTIEDLEPKIYDLITIKDLEPEPQLIADIENFKKQILQLKRSLGPFYDAISGIEKGISGKVQQKHLKYFYDLKDQCSQSLENAEALIQRLDSGINLFFSLQGHRMNQVMKTLTIVTSIFIPLSFIAGVYGMNFANMPELTWQYGYFAVLGLMAVLIIFSLLFFKKKEMVLKKMNWNNLLSTKRHGSQNRETLSNEKARTQFQRDYDRLIFSSPFRRLQNKTQVFPLPGSIFVHNRLTHSIEVASIGRSLGDMAAQELAKNPEINTDLIHELGAIVSTACLAHDLGNPPFGHSGESAISYYFLQGDGKELQSKVSAEEWGDLQHFEGNANAFRILAHQLKGRRKGGFALTYSSLAALVKYPFPSNAIPGKKKYGFFRPEQETYQMIAEELGIPCIDKEKGIYARHPLVYLVEAADDIAYQIMDLEDAHKLRILSTEVTTRLFLNFFEENKDSRFFEIKESVFQEVTDPNEQVAFLRASAISKLINETLQIFLANQKEILSGTFNGSLVSKLPAQSSMAMKAVSKISIEKIYNHPDVISIEVSGFNILGTLLAEFVPAVLNPENEYYKKLLSLIPEQYQTDSDSVYNKIQTVLDFISNMTDLYAVKIYRDIKGITTN